MSMLTEDFLVGKTDFRAVSYLKSRNSPISQTSHAFLSFGQAGYQLLFSHFLHMQAELLSPHDDFCFLSIYIVLRCFLFYNFIQDSAGQEQMGCDIGHYGIVVNQSSLPIEYIIYGKFEELGNTTTETEINPSVELSLDSVALNGFRLKKNSGVNNKYAKSFIRVEPTRWNITGLSQLKMDQHMISIRVIHEDYEKFILNDVIIKADSDMCLRIRSDLSIQHLPPKEIEIIKNTKQQALPKGNATKGNATKGNATKDNATKTQAELQGKGSLILNKRAQCDFNFHPPLTVMTDQSIMDRCQCRFCRDKIRQTWARCFKCNQNICRKCLSMKGMI